MMKGRLIKMSDGDWEWLKAYVRGDDTVFESASQVVRHLVSKFKKQKTRGSK